MCQIADWRQSYETGYTFDGVEGAEDCIDRFLVTRVALQSEQVFVGTLKMLL